MGAYLNRPVVEKEKEEGKGDGFSYACTTMQGWRANQEDAHNCVVNLHENWHMFAVYDGHGGTEVSKFASSRLPEFLKNRKFWESEDIDNCLKEAFIDFDDLIRSEDSMKELKEISNSGKKKTQDDSEDEADRIDTIEESAIPLAELIKRYGAGGGVGRGRSLLSAFLKDREGEDSDSGDEENEEEGEEEKDEEAEDNEAESEEKEESAEGKDEEHEKLEKEAADEDGKKKVQKRCSKSPIQSGTKKFKSCDAAEKTEGDATGEVQGSSSAASGVDAAAEEEESDQEFVADEDDAEDEEVSDEEIEGTDLSQFVLGGGGAETPGEDSGTTACVCLVGKDKVVVANAGDSRAVLCRAGKAVDLSVDHKPEDETEKNRIHAAGGIIEEGRVNGGLNLSRAFGDHAYKKNQDIPLKDQMITAHPDVIIEKLTPEDEFIVVACDGIWNSMESQQVVDFVRKLIADGKTCSEICDALCDECLADSTDGDGTGCDNMTVICTTFQR